MYEGCEKRLDVHFECTDANAQGLCVLPFALWEGVARAAGAEVLSQVRALGAYSLMFLRPCMQRGVPEIEASVFALAGFYQ